MPIFFCCHYDGLLIHLPLPLPVPAAPTAASDGAGSGVQQASNCSSGNFNQKRRDAVHWEGWGTSLAWWANALGGQMDLRETLCDVLFHPDSGLGFNIVRYNLGGADPAAAASYRAGAAVPCIKRRPSDSALDARADAAQLAVLHGALNRGVDIVEVFINSPPHYWCRSGSSRCALNLCCQHKKQENDRPVCAQQSTVHAAL
jgi:hypothetical protein